MFYTTLGLIAVGLLLVVDYVKRGRTNALLAAMGCKRPKYTLPIVGDTLRFLGMDIMDGVQLFKGLKDNYGKMVGIWLFYRCIVVVQDVKYFEYVLSSQRVITKSFFYDMLSSWLGDGLLLSTGSKWHKRRKIITPAFHFKILEQFVEIFDQQSRVMVQRLASKADGKTPVDIFPYVGMAALDIITESAMGVKINAQSDSDIPYTKALKSVIDIASNRFMKPLQHSNLGFILLDPRNYFAFNSNIKIMHKFTKNLINERRATLLQAMEGGTHESIDNLDSTDVGLKKRMTFLDVLLQSTIDGRSLSNDDIQEEVDTFTFEGHDTTTSGISFTLYNLSRHPEVQEKVFKEISQVLGNDFERPVRMTDLQELKYLECVIKESLRLYPSVPVISRVTDEDVKLGDSILPARTPLVLPIFSIGVDPECFDNPTEFRPERFSAGNMSVTNPYTYVPFSAGPRNCIGQKFALLEMKSTISSLVKHYELLPLGADIKPIVSVVLRSLTGVNMGLRKRSSV